MRHEGQRRSFGADLPRRQVNTVRIYNLDPTLNHDLCASIFNGVGIYMLIDVNSPLGGESLDRTNPGQSYHTDYLKRIFGIVEAFKGYPNTLGFFGGNEVINDDASAAIVPPYLRVDALPVPQGKDMDG